MNMALKKDSDWKRKSQQKQNEFRRFLDKANNASVIRKLPEIHEDTFAKINCLDCGNCCKNHSPTFKAKDIRRISNYLKMKESDFIIRYLVVDDENDMVLRSKPCPFLDPDNSCRIYEMRPGDCARYPYSDEDVFVKRPRITLANSMICPAVYHILEKISSNL